MHGAVRWGTYWAAAVLAGLTLSVFAALRDYGPESAVRRFHQATLDGDEPGLQRVTKEEVRSTYVLRLRQELERLGREGARIRMGFVQKEMRVDRSTMAQIPSVIAEVRYYSPRGVQSIYWVLDHDPGGWVVNATETWNFPKRLSLQGSG